MLTKVSIHDFLCGTEVVDADRRRHDGDACALGSGLARLYGSTEDLPLDGSVPAR